MAKRKNTPSDRSSISPFRRQIEKAPIPVPRASAGFVRLCHPKIYGLYFNKEDATNPWVSKGYTRWTMKDWEGTFSNTISHKEQGAQYIDGDGRKWEFFGYTIPLYDDGDKT